VVGTLWRNTYHPVRHVLLGHREHIHKVIGKHFNALALMLHVKRLHIRRLVGGIGWERVRDANTLELVQ
jgi:hypothetical protein